MLPCISSCEKKARGGCFRLPAGLNSLPLHEIQYGGDFYLWQLCFYMFFLQNFKQARSTHATANAHRYDNIFGAPALAFHERMPNQTRTCHAIGVTDRD